MQSTQAEEHPRALLVSIRTPKVTEIDAEESLAELKRLVTVYRRNKRHLKPESTPFQAR